MASRFLHSLYASIEWRIIAFLITNVFFWITTGSLVKATGLALALHLILFVAHTFWYFVHHELDSRRKRMDFISSQETKPASGEV